MTAARPPCLPPRSIRPEPAFPYLGQGEFGVGGRAHLRIRSGDAVEGDAGRTAVEGDVVEGRERRRPADVVFPSPAEDPGHGDAANSACSGIRARRPLRTRCRTIGSTEHGPAGDLDGALAAESPHLASPLVDASSVSVWGVAIHVQAQLTTDRGAEGAERRLSRRRRLNGSAVRACRTQPNLRYGILYR